VTPYAGRTLHGRVHRTYVSGHLAFLDGRLGEPHGETLLRTVAPDDEFA
jgi:hypothetical protein